MNDETIIVFKAKDLREIIRQELRATINPEPEFTKDRLSRTEAAKLAGVSLPTFAKMIKAGMFPEHGFGPKGKFYLRSEIVAGLKKEADKKNL